MIRYAIVKNARTRREAEAYLPDNYRVIHDHLTRTRGTAGGVVGGRVVHELVIAGEDVAGWTLDTYVIPRYASGLIACEEIDLSHPIMKSVPA